MGSANADLVRAAYELEYGGEDWHRWVDEHLSPEFEIEDRTLPDEFAGLSGSTAARAHAARMLDAFEQLFAGGEYQQIMQKWGLTEVSVPAPVLVSPCVRARRSGYLTTWSPAEPPT